MDYISSHQACNYYLLGYFPNQVALEVNGILAFPPTPAPYDTVKGSTCQKTPISEPKEHHELLFLKTTHDDGYLNFEAHANLLGDRGTFFDDDTAGTGQRS